MPFRIATITGTVQLLLRRKCYSRYSACPGLCQRISLCPPSKQTLARDNQALRSCHLVLQAEKINGFVLLNRSLDATSSDMGFAVSHILPILAGVGAALHHPFRRVPPPPLPCLPCSILTACSTVSASFQTTQAAMWRWCIFSWIHLSSGREKILLSSWPSFSEPGIWLPCTLTW